MAKGNLFQGMGRGKVGDVVFSRLNGEQVSRVRNRHPKNPRTNKQLIQRAIMATVMSAYSAGREIFDHSFEGYSTGAGCQRRFLSLNAGALRTQMAIDFENATPEAALAKVTAPKIQTAIPNQYIISEGSLREQLFSRGTSTNGPTFQLPAIVANETVAQYAARVGLVAGDIYTFVFMYTSVADVDVLFKALGIASVSYDTIFRGLFGWVRLITKNVSANNNPITSETEWTTLFDFETGGFGVDTSKSSYVGDTVDITTLINDDYISEGNGYSIGLIKSRRDQDLRSNCTMEVVFPEAFGLYWNDLLTAWNAGTTEIGASDLILEGGDE